MEKRLNWMFRFVLLVFRKGLSPWLRPGLLGFQAPEVFETAVLFPALSHPVAGPVSWLFASFVLACSLGGLTTVPMGVATFAWLMLTGGIFLDLKRATHARWMLTGVVLDIGLVLVLQWERNAVQTALARTLSEVQQLHIAASLGAVLLYFPALMLGRALLRTRQRNVDSRVLHRNVGRLAYLMRTLGYFLMFTMLNR